MSHSPVEPQSNTTAVLGAVLLLIGVVETFVTPDPDALFGPAMLVFGPAMLMLWWGGRVGSRPLNWLGQGLATIGVALALFDIGRDLFGG